MMKNNELGQKKPKKKLREKAMSEDEKEHESMEFDGYNEFFDDENEDKSQKEPHSQVKHDSEDGISDSLFDQNSKEHSEKADNL